MKRHRLTLCAASAALGMLVCAVAASAMTVEEAYQAIPHARTVFDEQASRIVSSEKQSLVTLFGLVDEAIVIKMQALQSNTTGGGAYKNLQNRLAVSEVPRKLKKFHKLLSEAIAAQENYLKRIPRPALSSDKDVARSSQKLRQAYDELIRLYPNEPQNNAQAFFDYLCALDFI